MSKVFAINAGSSSLKFQLLEMPDATVIASGLVERIGQPEGLLKLVVNESKTEVNMTFEDHEVAANAVLEAIALHGIIDSLNEIVAVGHRLVHGGELFSESVEATHKVIEALQELNELAPLHNPANLVGLKAFQHALPQAFHALTFDTAFHQTMVPKHYLYALPYEYYTDHHIRRYGMHGISHQYVSQRVAQLMNKDIKSLNIIALHLGNGASITAIEGGKSVNTSMGFTPLPGVMMGTRTGDVDPAIIPYLVNRLNISAQEIIDIMNRHSGMLGVSGISSDARDIETAFHEGNHRARLTIELYAEMARHYVGSYAMQLGRVDALVFTAGIGENDALIRAAILDALHGFKLSYDRDLNNETRSKEMKLSDASSELEVWVVPTNEELVIAQDAYRLFNVQ